MLNAGCRRDGPHPLPAPWLTAFSPAVCVVCVVCVRVVPCSARMPRHQGFRMFMADHFDCDDDVAARVDAVFRAFDVHGRGCVCTPPPLSTSGPPPTTQRQTPAILRAAGWACEFCVAHRVTCFALQVSNAAEHPEWLGPAVVSHHHRANNVLVCAVYVASSTSVGFSFPCR